jgi:diguanylate cyclase (GGDEF)-like protein/PAS domain S-box-containing protein
MKKSEHRLPMGAFSARRSTMAVLPMWFVTALITTVASLSVTAMFFMQAYVAGESQWSKGEKDAVAALLRFAHSGSEADYQRFLDRIAVPLGDHAAKLEMNRAAPDHAVIKAGFLAGQIAPQDIDGMIWLYRSFADTPLFSRALTFWDLGDQYILELMRIGRELHARVTGQGEDDLDTPALVARLRDIDDQLSPIEHGFSIALEVAARETRDALILTLVASTLLLVIGFTLSIRRSLLHRERLDAQLRQSEERFSLGFEGMNAGLWDFDLVRDQVYYSPQLYEQFGYRMDELSLDIATFHSLIHPDDLLRTQAALRAHMEANAIFDIELRLRMRQGHYVWCRSAGKCIRDPAGRPVRMVGSLFDISDRKQAELDAHRARELAEVTLASIGDAVIRIDELGCVTYCNAMTEHMLGRAVAEITMRPFASVFELYDDAGLAQTILCFGRIQPVAHESRYQTASGLHLVRSDGTRLPVHYAAAPMHDVEGTVIGTVVVLRDVSAERKHAAQLSYQATHDELTDLFNRREFELRLGRLLEDDAQSGVGHAVMFLDLDQFKVVNDTCGHAAGDELIRHVGRTLKAHLRRGDVLARLGGDEFGVVLPWCAPHDAIRIANELRNALDNIRLAWSDAILTTSVSIGVVASGEELHQTREIMKAADAACYMAKEKGRNRVHLFSHDDLELTLAQTQMEWVSRVRTALEHDRFCLYAQKILSLKPDDVEGDDDNAHFELLLRMRDESGQIIGPALFIGAAERFNLMPAIDRWVIRRAFATIAQSSAPGVTWSINLSGTSIGDERLLDYIIEQKALHGISFRQVCFEITETAAITNLQKANALIGKLRALGCRFALDDFGVGMASFNYLKHLQVDYLKIDGSFIKELVTSPLDRAIVRSIAQVAHAAGKQTIAEFVENEAIIECLREMGVDYAQGYGVGHPMPIPTPSPQGTLEDAPCA